MNVVFVEPSPFRCVIRGSNTHITIEPPDVSVRHGRTNGSAGNLPGRFPSGRQISVYHTGQQSIFLHPCYVWCVRVTCVYIRYCDQVVVEPSNVRLNSSIFHLYHSLLFFLYQLRRRYPLIISRYIGFYPEGDGCQPLDWALCGWGVHRTKTEIHPYLISYLPTFTGHNGLTATWLKGLSVNLWVWVAMHRCFPCIFTRFT